MKEYALTIKDPILREKFLSLVGRIAALELIISDLEERVAKLKK